MKSFEDVLAFSQIRQYLSQEEQDNIAAAMGMTIDEIDRRLEGKRKEDEFILILLFMGVCKNLSGFDEGLSKLGDRTYTSDLIIELKSGKKFLLEIKSTKKDDYKISSVNLQKRMDYAASLGLDLYFAICLYNMWLLYPADYIKGNKGKITIADVTKSYLDEVIGTISYIFPPKLTIRSVYNKNTKKGLGIFFEPYGELVSYELLYDERRIFRVKGKNSWIKGYMMILEALQDRLANIKQVITESGDHTIILDYDDSDNYNFIPEYCFLLAPVMHTEKSSGDGLNTADSVIADLKSDREIAKFETGHYWGMVMELVRLGVPIKYIRNRTIYEVPNPDKVINKK